MILQGMEDTKKEKTQPLLEKDGRENKSKYLEIVGKFVLNNYLPICLLIFVIFGALVPQPGNAINTKATKYVCIILIFIYTGLYLQTKAMKEAITSYKAAIWGFISILGVTCVVGGGLTKLLNDKTRSSIVPKNNFTNSSTHVSAIGPLELRYGLQIYMVMPCTISSGVVMVRFIFLFLLVSFLCFWFISLTKGKPVQVKYLQEHLQTYLGPFQISMMDVFLWNTQ